MLCKIKGKLVGVSKFVIPGLVLAASAMAQAADPNATVAGASATATTSWTGFAVLSASAFVFAMVIGYARKGKK